MKLRIKKIKTRNKAAPPGPHWIWYPSRRTLPNTFVLFRRAIEVRRGLKKASGWISADSRYLLTLNGRRLQWGPAPCDPRWLDQDPFDLSDRLHVGQSVLGVTVLFYGHPEGTWAIGKPGLLFDLKLTYEDGPPERVVSDSSWWCHLCRAWPMGQYRRWFSRSLQEEFDARLYPHGWTDDGFKAMKDWLPAMKLAGSPAQPSLCANYEEYAFSPDATQRSDASLRLRSIPPMDEKWVSCKQLVESAWLEWNRPPEEYFAMRIPNAYREIRESPILSQKPDEIVVGCRKNRSAALTFEFQEQLVGWPCFSVDAPAGTVIELVLQESHQPGGPVLLDSHYFIWARLICKEGINDFECFDYESFRWLQLVIRNASRPVKIRSVGARRRRYPWPWEPEFKVDEPLLQKLMEASVNTLHCSAQETIMDGVGRERQQYSGDCSQQILAIYHVFGETRQAARFLETWSQGQGEEGWFLDCWPGSDRLVRIWERFLGLTHWGPLLDHGIGFNFDCWNHLLYTGRKEDVRLPFQRLLRFWKYMEGIVDKNGLLPVENLGVPSVWMDHEAYASQRHRQCSFNLYAIAALRDALLPMARALHQDSRIKPLARLANRLHKAAIRRFWDPDQKLFVDNLPWRDEEGGERLSDRSLAHAILSELNPGKKNDASLNRLMARPASMGISYPANSGWRLWAMARCNQINPVLEELRSRWSGMRSVLWNNTLGEHWDSKPDSTDEWAHCPVIPLHLLYTDIAGIRPIEMGFARCRIHPQLGGLAGLHLVSHTVRGPLRFSASRGAKGYHVRLDLPPGCSAEWQDGAPQARPRLLTGGKPHYFDEVRL